MPRVTGSVEMINANEAQASSKSSALFTISVSSGEVVLAATRA
jgi:hypothetical protein